MYLHDYVKAQDYRPHCGLWAPLWAPLWASVGLAGCQLYACIDGCQCMLINVYLGRPHTPTYTLKFKMVVLIINVMHRLSWLWFLLIMHAFTTWVITFVEWKSGSIWSLFYPWKIMQYFMHHWSNVNNAILVNISYVDFSWLVRM